MSAGGPGVIGPVSVRYAAQIRELLFARAMQRMAADHEAARAESDRTVRAEAAAKSEQVQPLHARIEPPAPARQPDAPVEGQPPRTSETARFVDIQA
jgi:hypothetical protein